MTGGSVPGTGDQDTVPRTLDAGAFVIRKAAVRKYGAGTLAQLANGVARFATGGAVLFGDVAAASRAAPSATATWSRPAR